jgi:hypothetical protein
MARAAPYAEEEEEEDGTGKMCHLPFSLKEIRMKRRRMVKMIIIEGPTASTTLTYILLLPCHCSPWIYDWG